MEALAGAVPKDDHPLFVRPIKEAVATAVEKEKRKRRNASVAAAAKGEPAPRFEAQHPLVAGFCLPKALAPILPMYLAGVLQVGGGERRGPVNMLKRPPFFRGVMRAYMSGL